MKYFSNTYLIVFGILLVYLLFNIPIYFQAYTYKIQIIRLQELDLFAWINAIGFIFLLFFCRKVFILIEPSIAKTYLIWIAYSLVSVVALLRFSYHWEYYLYLIFTLFPYYILFIILIIGYKPLNQFNLKAFIEKITEIIAIIYIPVFVFALVQFLFANNFLELNTTEKTLQATSELLGTFRPRSIFNSSFEFGLFAVFVFTLFASRLKNVNGSWNWFNMAISIISILGVIISFTRNIYLIGLMCIINILLLKRYSSRALLLKFIPFSFVLVFSILLVILAIQALSGSRLTDFMSNESTFVRFTFLYSLMDGLVSNGNIMDVLFGWGLIQHAGDSSLISIFPDIYNSEDGSLGIDNLFFALFLLQGLTGLGIFLFLYQKVWNKLCKIYNENQSALSLSVAALFGSFLGAGVFNLIHSGVFWNLTWFFTFGVLAVNYSSNKSNNTL